MEKQKKNIGLAVSKAKTEHLTNNLTLVLSKMYTKENMEERKTL